MQLWIHLIRQEEILPTVPIKEWIKPTKESSVKYVKMQGLTLSLEKRQQLHKLQKSIFPTRGWHRHLEHCWTAQKSYWREHRASDGLLDSSNPPGWEKTTHSLVTDISIHTRPMTELYSDRFKDKFLLIPFPRIHFTLSDKSINWSFLEEHN